MGKTRKASVSRHLRRSALFAASFLLELVPNSPAHAQQRSSCGRVQPYLTRAQTALAAKDGPTAAKELGEAVKIAPTCADAHLLLGLSAFQSGDLAKSIQYYQAAIKLSPRSYSAHYDLALVYLRQKKLRLARRELEQAVALDPKQGDAAYDLGIVLLELGEPTAALVHLRRAHDLTPGRPDVSFNIVRAELEAGHLVQARGAAEQATPSLASDVQWNAAIGQQFLDHAQPEDALPYLRTANALRPGDESIRKQLATTYLALHQVDRVLELIGDANTADEHYLRGSAFYQAHRFSDADAESDAALTMAPENPRILVLRVRLLQRAGQQQAALDMAQKASRLAPEWDEPFYLAGISYYFLRHYSEAHQSFTRAFEINPRSATAIFMAALAAANEGQPKEAERLLRRAIALQPDNTRFHCHLGIVLIRQNEYEKAELSLKRAAQLKPDYPLPHYELGKLWVYSKRWKEARDAFESVIAVDPSFTSAYYHLARVYTRLGEKEKSESALAEFKRLHSQETDDTMAVEEDARNESGLR